VRIERPKGVGLLNFFDAISLRAAVDPLSPLNATGEPHALAVQLTDGAGNTAVLRTRPDEPALQFHLEQHGDDFIGDIFTVRAVDTIRFNCELRRQPDGHRRSGRTVRRQAWRALFLADVGWCAAGGAQDAGCAASPESAAAEAGDVEAVRG
jgi:hypothetical protein